MSFQITEVSVKELKKLPAHYLKIAQEAEKDPDAKTTSSKAKEVHLPLPKRTVMVTEPHKGKKTIVELSNNTDGVKYLEGEDFMLCPSADVLYPDRITLIGKSGLGKSTWVSKYLKRFKDMFPENKVYLISRKKNDPAYDGLSLEVLNPSDYLDEPLRVEEFRYGSCVVFDDFETFTGAELKCVLAIRDDLLMVGRSRNVSVLMCAHTYKGGKLTQPMYLECTHILIFTITQEKLGKDMLMCKYGMTKELVDKIYSKKRKEEGRWALIRPDYPSYVMTPKSLVILEEE